MLGALRRFSYAYRATTLPRLLGYQDAHSVQFSKVPLRRTVLQPLGRPAVQEHLVRCSIRIGALGKLCRQQSAALPVKRLANELAMLNHRQSMLQNLLETNMGPLLLLACRPPTPPSRKRSTSSARRFALCKLGIAPYRRSQRLPRAVRSALYAIFPDQGCCSRFVSRAVDRPARRRRSSLRLQADEAYCHRSLLQKVARVTPFGGALNSLPPSLVAQQEPPPSSRRRSIRIATM